MTANNQPIYTLTAHNYWRIISVITLVLIAVISFVLIKYVGFIIFLPFYIQNKFDYLFH
jgi:hypothetical protein